MSKNGRTFWDFAAESPEGLFFGLVALALVMAAIFQR